MKDVFAALALLKEMVDGAKAIAAFIEANKDEAWFKASADAYTAIKAAKTPEDRRALAKSIRGLWASLD